MVGRETQEAGEFKMWIEGETISDRCKGGERSDWRRERRCKEGRDSGLRRCREGLKVEGR